MSSNPNHTETAQQLQIARQEAEFAAEMDWLEEEAAQEEEEKRIEEEKRVAKEKRVVEEKRAAEEKRIAEEKLAEERNFAEVMQLAEERKLAEVMQLEEERIAELRRFKEEIINEEKRVAEEKKQEKIRIAETKRREEEQVAEAEDAQEQNNSYAKLVEENRMEKEKAAKKLAKRREPAPNTAQPVVSVVIPPRASGSISKVFKSKSDDMVMDEREVETSRSVKRKCPIKMIAKNGNFPDPTSDRDVEEDDEDAGSPSQSCSACTRTQACEPCHVQRQQCSWIGDHASQQSRGKRAKLEDDVYRGPTVRVTDRKFAGPEIAEQLAVLAGQNLELVGITWKFRRRY
ncbi:hypothetical protein GGU11DRAFT_749158 [Lentinula aff. detonsa]|nr:hypothetical protein GGU11DRAFT_749158 [Lentinula aff. detonsa]